MRGCPAISYGWGRGHVRVNNRAFRRFGLADVVDDAGRAARPRSRARSTQRPHRRPTSFDGLPSAASFVLARRPMRAERRTLGVARARGLVRAGGRAGRAAARRGASASRCRLRVGARHRDHVRRRAAPARERRPCSSELERAGARATFFLVGEQVERRPALAAEIAAAGHEIGDPRLPAHAAAAAHAARAARRPRRARAT